MFPNGHMAKAHSQLFPSPLTDLPPLHLPLPPQETHHLFQLILNLPVDFSHLKENVSWKGRKAGKRGKRKVKYPSLWPLQPPVAGKQGAGGPVQGQGKGQFLLVAPRRNGRFYNSKGCRRATLGVGGKSP